MRHNMHGRKLGRTSTHRIAMLRNMATSLFRHERITTTVQKAKTLRPFAEKLITLAKRETVHARRLVNRHIHDKEILSKLFSDISVRYATRPGGYTRIIKTTFRRGDNAEMAIIELVGEEMTSKPKKRKAAKKKAAPKKDAAKKVATAEPVVEEAETPAEEAGAAAATAAQEAAEAIEEATEDVKADTAEEAEAKDKKAEEDKKE